MREGYNNTKAQLELLQNKLSRRYEERNRLEQDVAQAKIDQERAKRSRSTSASATRCRKSTRPSAKPTPASSKSYASSTAASKAYATATTPCSGR